MSDNIEKKQYHILYSRVADQEKIRQRLRLKLDDDSDVVIPHMEYYRRGEKKIKIKPVFPGYTFIKTSMDPLELHAIVREVAKESQIGIRELDFSEQYKTGDGKFRHDDTDVDFDTGNIAHFEYHSCVTPEETLFLDFLCQDDGLFKMSEGYEENKKYYVMDGPLKVFEDKIFYVDKHNRKALLNFELDGRRARAGFECKPKAHYFPDEDAKLTYLSDGTEVDLNELEKKIMSGE